MLPDKGPGFVGEMIAWITEAKNSFRRTAAPYRAMLKGLCSFDIGYEYLPGDNPFDQLSSSIDQPLADELIE